TVVAAFDALSREDRDYLRQYFSGLREAIPPALNSLDRSPAAAFPSGIAAQSSHRQAPSSLPGAAIGPGGDPSVASSSRTLAPLPSADGSPPIDPQPFPIS